MFLRPIVYSTLRFLNVALIFSISWCEKGYLPMVESAMDVNIQLPITFREAEHHFRSVHQVSKTTRVAHRLINQQVWDNEGVF